jgi:magnesium chelatase subunit D
MRAAVARTGTLLIDKEDLREKVREKKISSVLVFVVDASGSMGARHRMEVAKGAVLALLEDSYQKREKVGFVAFRGDKAEVLLPPTSSVELAARYLRELPTGGKTPLPDGLYQGLQTLKNEKRKTRNIIPILVLVSDGKGNVPIRSSVREEVISLAGEIKEQGINLVIIDSNHGLLNLGYNREIAEVGGGEYHILDSLDSQGMVEAIKPLREAE